MVDFRPNCALFNGQLKPFGLYKTLLIYFSSWQATSPTNSLLFRLVRLISTILGIRACFVSRLAIVYAEPPELGSSWI